VANKRRLEGRIALITGASRGIGAAVAKAYGVEGAQLILLARTVGGLEEVDDAVRQSGGLPATLVPLDITDGDGIDRMGAALFERYGRLDVLVGNAGSLGTLTPTSHVEPKIWQQTMEINATANARLIRSMDPLLRQSDAARAIFVTSGVTTMNPPYWAAYAASKAAMEALVMCWAGELNKTNIHVNLLDPGVIRTAMRARAFPGEDPQTLPRPDSVVEAFIQMALPDWTGNGERILASGIT
jgi:NAD(P)-dependent dehydrogenase (short-subunit alcohol dehydrogenase family)